MPLRGSHAGDRRMRLGRVPAQQEVRLPLAARRRRPPNPALVIVAGFAGFIVAGTLLLLLPISNVGGTWAPVTTALFTAASAVCVTGLVVVDTGTYWSGFGQWVILLLIKVGGVRIHDQLHPPAPPDGTRGDAPGADSR